MARRTFGVIDVTEILVHWHAGRSLSEISGVSGNDAEEEAVCWLLADGEFGISIWQAALEKREAEDLPGLPAVVGTLRKLAG